MNQAIWIRSYSILLIIGVCVFRIAAQGTHVEQLDIMSQRDAVSQAAKPIPLEVPYRVALDRVHERASMRLVLIGLQTEYFDLCNLRIIFGQIRRNFPALHLTVEVYTDKKTLDAMVKFRQAEDAAGARHFENSPEGLKAAEKYYFELGYPVKLTGQLARFERNDLGDTLEQYLEYTPDKGNHRFVRHKVF